MILSVSRRTDIPAFYSEWFYNRVKEGFICVRNPMYPEKVSKVAISQDVIDCIVFWTKNAEPMLERLSELDGYHYFFQYTINGYGSEIEPVAGKNLIKNLETFISLSKRIGSEKIIWRYDPIFLSDTYTVKYHMETFKKIAEKLSGYTNCVVISFIDLYGQTERNMPKINSFNEVQIREFVAELVKISDTYGMKIETCAEKIDLSAEGVGHGHCIDKSLIEDLIGYKITGGKDASQRAECGCMQSIDIGVYNTCKNGCKYCYANYSDNDVKTNTDKYDSNSAFLCDQEKPGDIITERQMKSLRRKR